MYTAERTPILYILALEAPEGQEGNFREGNLTPKPIKYQYFQFYLLLLGILIFNYEKIHLYYKSFIISCQEEIHLTYQITR